MKFKNPFRPKAKPDYKASRSAPLLVPFGAKEAVFTPRHYDALAREGYQKNAVAYRCIRLVSQNAAAVPWALFEGSGADRRRLDDHPILHLLHRPNPVQGGAELFEAMFAFYLIAGNAYTEAVGPKGQPPLELWTLRPDRMRIVPGTQGVPAAYRYSANGTQVEYKADTLTGQADVMHLKAFHPLDDWYGMSALEAAAFSIDQHNEAALWNASLLQSSGRPSGALVYKPSHPEALDTLTETQREALRTEIEQYFSGSRNAGRPLVLEGGLDWRDMSLSPKDMDWLAGKDVSAREIALAFNVPPQLVGIEGSLTFANFEQARLSLFDDAVLPLLDRVKDAMNNWLCPRFGDNLTLEYDTDGIEALAPRRAETWSRITAASFMTLNEKRRAFGLAPLDGGDTLAG
ncbi:MAG: phage portal protein [Micavibrio sp.]|nr:phage portal protein [Micavibrio sp.]